MEGVDEEKVKALLKEVARDQEHYAAFGRFITSYTFAEALVHAAVRHFSGLDDDAARIIFGGMRLGDLAERLRKLTRSKAAHNEINICLTHLEQISKARHKLVHRMVSRDPSAGLRVSNRMTVASLLDAEEDFFDVETLSNMDRDCVSIAIRLLLLTERANEKIRTRFGSVYGPWRYKPPPPKPKRKARRAIPRRQRRPPPASPG